MVEVQRTTMVKPVDRELWLAARRPYFNASDAAVLFDRHPYRTAGDVATIKLTGVEQERTQAMERGLRLEGVIADWWAEADGECFVEEPKVLYIAGRVMATVDRVATGGEWPAPIPVEIKTANVYAPVPQPYWLDQCQAIMLAMGAPALALVWFDATMRLQWTMVNADVRLQDDILAGAERFMAAIDLGMVPDWVSLSYANQAALHPEARKPEVELDDRGYNMVVALATIRRARIAAEREEERIKAEIAGELGDAEVGTYGGMDVVRWANVKGRRELDVKRLAAEQPELVADYWIQRDGHRRMVPVGMDQEDAA